MTIHSLVLGHPSLSQNLHSPLTSPICTPCSTCPSSPSPLLPSTLAFSPFFPPPTPSLPVYPQATLLALPNELLFQIASHLCEWTPEQCEIIHHGRHIHFSTGTYQYPHQEPTAAASLRSLYHLALTCQKLQPLALLVLIGHWRKNVNPYGGDLLHWILREGCESANLVRLLLETTGSNLKNLDRLDFTPLHCSLTWGDCPHVVLLLVNKGADLQAIDKVGLSPLHVAVLWGRWKSLEVLLKKGANVEATDVHGFTAMHFAASKWDVGEAKRAVKILHRFGGSLVFEDNTGASSVLIAARRGETAKGLLEMMLNLNPETGVKNYRDAVVEGECEPVRMIGAWRYCGEKKEMPTVGGVDGVGIRSDGKVAGGWRWGMDVLKLWSR